MMYGMSTPSPSQGNRRSDLCQLDKGLPAGNLGDVELLGNRPGRDIVPQGMRRDALVDARLPRGQMNSVPDHFRRDGAISAPAVMRPRKQIGLRPHPAVVVAQRREERGTEWHFAIP